MNGFVIQYHHFFRPRTRGSGCDIPVVFSLILLCFGIRVSKLESGVALGYDAEVWTTLGGSGVGGDATPQRELDYHMEKLFQVLGCPDNFKTRLAAFKLEGDALSWWKAHLRTQVGGDAFADTCTWVAFREIFYNSCWRCSKGKLAFQSGLKNGFRPGLKKLGFGPDRLIRMYNECCRAVAAIGFLIRRQNFGVDHGFNGRNGNDRQGQGNYNQRQHRGQSTRNFNQGHASGSANQRRSTETLPPPPL
ncbi:hypothetical protein Tco_1474774 [Tanacetum coccineum]